MTLALKKINDEVFLADEAIVRMSADHVDFLKRQAKRSVRRRARICAHRNSDDPLHEMLIALNADSYVHPHKHVNKSESFHVVEGQLDVAVLDDYGAIVEIIELGDLSTGKPFFYRLADSFFHTLLIHTDFLIMHEVTNGPFIADDALLAPFAPPEGRREEALAYIAELKLAAATHRLAHLQLEPKQPEES